MRRPASPSAGPRCWRCRCADSARAAGAHSEQHVLPCRDGGLAAATAGPGRCGRYRRGPGGAAGSEGVAAAGSDPGSDCSNSSCASGATGRSGRSNSGSINSLAASSTAVTVPPCAPGVNRKWARFSERPARQDSRTVQRPSSLRQASQVVASVPRPRSVSAAETVSSRVSTAGPSASTGWAAVASSAARRRSSRTGWAKRSTRETSTPEDSATSSTVAPARMRAWMSRGRNTVRTSLSLAVWSSRERSPRTAARSLSSSLIRNLSAGSPPSQMMCLPSTSSPISVSSRMSASFCRGL